MSAGNLPAREAALRGAAVSAAQRKAETAEGIAWARAWRERNRARFDAIYGPGPMRRCKHCGRAL